jgi:hypothetical protein
MYAWNVGVIEDDEQNGKGPHRLNVGTKLRWIVQRVERLRVRSAHVLALLSATTAALMMTPAKNELWQ